MASDRAGRTRLCPGGESTRCAALARGRSRAAVEHRRRRTRQRDPLLDDGFQHRRLQRELDVVLIDATNPWGHGYLFPRGLLRESPRNLEAGRADCAHTAATRFNRRSSCNLRRVIAAMPAAQPIAETVHRPTELGNGAGSTAALDVLQNQPVAAFCGIGKSGRLPRDANRLAGET